MTSLRANGWRYPLVGETRGRHFAGTNSKPHELPRNAQTPTSRVHAVLGADELKTLMLFKNTLPEFPIMNLTHKTAKFTTSNLLKFAQLLQE